MVTFPQDYPAGRVFYGNAVFRSVHRKSGAKLGFFFKKGQESSVLVFEKVPFQRRAIHGKASLRLIFPAAIEIFAAFLFKNY